MRARPSRHPEGLRRVAQRRYTIPITCCLDGQAHDVTDESAAAGKRTGQYLALCGYVVSAAPLIAPVGRRCARCAAVSAAATAPIGRPRHRLHRRLWRFLRPHGNQATAGAIPRRLP